ncbi:MAG: acyltransferase [Acidobacteriota bacterium]
MKTERQQSDRDPVAGRVRLVAIDRLRAWSILGVVTIHATSPMLAGLVADGSVDTTYFKLLAAVNQLGRFSVPAFFLIAGFLTTLGGSSRPGDPFAAHGSLKRRMIRLLAPYLIWSTVFFAMPHWIGGGGVDGGFLRRFLIGDTFTGGYFLIVLAQLTLLAGPLARLGIGRRRVAWALCGSLLAGTIGLFTVAAHSAGPDGELMRSGFSASLSLFIPWASFFLAGILLGLSAGRGRPVPDSWRPICMTIAVIAYTSSLLEFDGVLAASGSLGLAASFLKPSSIVFALAVCTACLAGVSLDRSSPGGGIGASGIARPVMILATGAYAVYLIHGGIIRFLLGIDGEPWHSLLHGPAGPALLALGSLTLALIGHRAALRFLPRHARFLLFG